MKKIHTSNILAGLGSYKADLKKIMELSKLVFLNLDLVNGQENEGKEGREGGGERKREQEWERGNWQKVVLVLVGLAEKFKVETSCGRMNRTCVLVIV